MPSRLSIPAITDQRLIELADRIRPIYEDVGVLTWMEVPDMRRVAFTWDPKPSRPAEEGLEAVARIRTLHSYGYYGFFKPSVAEVLAQIPAEWLDKVAGFSTCGPDNVDDLNRESEALNAGFHVAVTTLYRLNSHKAVGQQKS